MKVSTVIRMAMLNEGVKSAKALADMSGITYGTVDRALHDKNVGISVVVKLLDCMGYQLKAELK